MSPPRDVLEMRLLLLQRNLRLCAEMPGNLTRCKVPPSQDIKREGVALLEKRGPKLRLCLRDFVSQKTALSALSFHFWPSHLDSLTEEPPVALNQN